MSTSKHIDKICIAAIAVTLVLTIVFMCGGALGITAIAQTMKYEQTLFDTSKVHSIDIVMNDWDSFIETCENEEYATCTVAIDGEKYSNIAIRAKGNTSLSNVSSMNSTRYSFKLEFDHYEDAKTLDGLDKLCLNNLIQDNTMMKDYLVYQMMNDFGVDTPLCSFAYLTVNGEDWGLYLAVEGVEDSFLSRNYGSDVGELYKPDSMSFGGGRGNGKDFNMDDFDFDAIGENAQGGSVPQMPNGESATVPSMPEGQQSEGTERQSGFPTMPNGGFNGQGNMPSMPNGDSTVSMPDFSDLFDGEMPDMSDFGGGDQQMGGNMGGGMGSDDVKLKYIDDDPDSYSNIFDNAKTDVSSADQKRLIQALKNLSNYENLEDSVAIEEVIRYFVVHNFVCNGDSYTGSMIHNYYLHEDDGQLSMIPWDYNLAFGTFQGGDASSSVNADIDSPVSGGNVDDRPMLGWIFSEETYTAQYHELFGDFLEKWFTNGELAQLITETADLIRPYVEKDPSKFCTAAEFEAGVTAITEFVTLRAEAVSRQLNGDDTAVDTGSLNVSDMGTMGNTMGGDKQNMPGGNADGQPQAPNGEGTENSENQPAEVPEKTDGAVSAAPTDEKATASKMSFTQTANNTAPQMPSGQMPNGGGQMPGGFGGGSMPQGANSGSMPEMPNGFGGGSMPEGFGEGDSNGEQPPEMPDGNGQMPTESAENESSAEAPNQEINSGDSTEGRKFADDAQQSGQQNGGSDAATSSGDAAVDGTTSQPAADGRQKEQQGGTRAFDEMPNGTTANSANETVLLLVVSVIVLGLGIVIAAKKKY